jgi:hypothetical protein
MGLVVSSPGMIIINRESIYEMYGTDFEGGNYTLNRVGSNRGSLATKATIKTVPWRTSLSIRTVTVLGR